MYAPVAYRSAAAPAARVCATAAARLLTLGLYRFRPTALSRQPLTSIRGFAGDRDTTFSLDGPATASFDGRSRGFLGAVAPASSRDVSPPCQHQTHDTDAAQPRSAVCLPAPTQQQQPHVELLPEFDDVSSTPAGTSFAAIRASQTPVSSYDPDGLKGSPASHLDKALRSVVKVFCTSANPNYSQPWQMMSQTKSIASGFVVAPLSARRILTNAHAVANQVQVMLRKHGNAKKFPAKVLAVGHECDIAMLTVEADEFWDGGVEGLEVGSLPPMQESVTVVGFPLGGDNVCVTKGVASRLDRQKYSHGQCSLLTVQTDAPINSGNSGGPVLAGDKVVGLAFQSMTNAENTGYVIPTPVVNHFLNDLERHGGQYTGFPEMGISWQCLESADMKRSLGMPDKATGVYITGTEPAYDSSKVLRAGDVLTSVNGHGIADDGTFLYPGQSVRISFLHLPSMAYDGDIIKVGVWREGEALELPLRVHAPRALVPSHCHDLKPKYYIFAGLVFTRLTNFYLRHQYGADWSTRAPIKLCERYFSGSMEAVGQEVVVLSKVLSAEVNQGFQEMANMQVYKVNGVKVHNLAHLARLVEECDSDYIRFDLEWKRVIILNTATGRGATPDILSTNGIPAAASEGLLREDLHLPPDLTAVSQPNMADSEIVGGEDAVAVDERKARQVVKQPSELLS